MGLSLNFKKEVKRSIEKNEKNINFIPMSLLRRMCFNINTDNELVSIKGLSEEGTHFFISPYGRTEISGSNVIGGEGKVILPRSRTDYNATIICPDGKEIVIPIESSFDMVKGLYLPILYTISSFGWGILQAFPSSVIDYYSDNAYSVNEIVLPDSCVD